MKTLFRHSRRNRPLDIILFALIVLGILAVLRFLPVPEPVEVSGIARVIDSDSLRLLRCVQRPDSHDRIPPIPAPPASC